MGSGFIEMMVNLFFAFQEYPEVGLDAVVGICQALSPNNRAEILKYALSQLQLAESDSGNTNN